MGITDTEKIYEGLGISREVWEYGQRTESRLKERFEEFDKNAEYNQMKVIRAMQENRVSEGCFNYVSGYGYNDLGRDTLESVYASVFHTEAALVRPQITCGTHALALALAANLRPGDELLSPVGKPYDTLEEVIGIRPSKGSLAEYGITYRQVELLEDGYFDYPAIEAALNEKIKLVTIQRSKGYQTRPSYSVEKIGELIAFIKERRPDVICMVDNCYGEFVERIEPSDVGADMIVGSLIKNPGGGLAPIGGYIAGREDLGYPVVPDGKESRHDIIQAVTLGSAEGVIAFCKGIQAAAPVDSYVSPEPWAMPGYDSDVIMAAGAFVQGSSIELSADGPVKPPYAVYFQGGLTWYHAKLGILKSLQSLLDAGVVSREQIEQA